jgi:hypothetical protein
MATQTIQYGPYELICTATPLPAGGYSASLAVAIEHGNAREANPIPLVQAPTFASEAEAMEHAAAIGRDWVDNHG